LGASRATDHWLQTVSDSSFFDQERLVSWWCDAPRRKTVLRTVDRVTLQSVCLATSLAWWKDGYFIHARRPWCIHCLSGFMDMTTSQGKRLVCHFLLVKMTPLGCMSEMTRVIRYPIVRSKNIRRSRFFKNWTISSDLLLHCSMVQNNKSCSQIKICLRLTQWHHLSLSEIVEPAPCKRKIV
jgi:hypothetical protein